MSSTAQCERRRLPRKSEELAHRQLDKQLSSRQKLASAVLLVERELAQRPTEELEAIHALLKDTETDAAHILALQRQRWVAVQEELTRAR